MDTDGVLLQLRRVVNQLLFLKKKRMFSFEGVDFYPSEVHLMLVIRDRVATNATRIAEELGVTKGAVSQSLSRLERKGVLVKSRDADNKNELTLTFTPLGKRALDHYQEQTRGVFDGARTLLDGYSPNQRRAVEAFLEEVERGLDGLPG
jgi:DNA-binding MarR family transcriptional regulator